MVFSKTLISIFNHEMMLASHLKLQVSNIYVSRNERTKWFVQALCANKSGSDKKGNTLALFSSALCSLYCATLP